MGHAHNIIWYIKVRNGALGKYLPGLRCALAVKQLVKYTLFYGKDINLFSV